jgi:Protein of unknown function (DUF3048) N-terminal domain/Protein of unknown function (DUF3048) C-terminal domain
VSVQGWLAAHRRLLAVTAAVLAVLAVAAVALVVSGHGPQLPSSGSAPGGSGSSGPGQNALTGLPGTPAGPVVGVKVDNTARGRPQWGLNDADIVYVEQAEGGLTRLVAVFASRRPAQVGPVRSVRGSDPELLASYGQMALAFSGGAANELAAFRASGLVDASAAAHPDAYARVGTRRAPYNLVVNIATLSRDVASATPVRDVGFRWAADDPQLGQAPAVSTLTATVGGTPVSFRWDSGRRRWLQTIRGAVVTDANGRPLSTPNVLVQFCRISLDYRDIDQAGSPAAYTHTVGTGPAVLFRDGRRIDGTWSRPRPEDPTRFRTASGADLLMRPGGAWVVLAASGAPLAAS